MRGNVGSRPRRTRRILIWTLLSVVMVAILAVGAIVAYSQFRDNELPAGIPPRPAAIVVDPADQAGLAGRAHTVVGGRAHHRGPIKAPSSASSPVRSPIRVPVRCCGPRVPTNRASRHPTPRC